VVGADSDAAKIAALQRGECPFYEPGMQELLLRHRNNPRFQLTDDIESAIRAGTILFICVGTPQRENGAPDLSQVEFLAHCIGRNLNGYKLIVEKSTVPAITGQWVKKTVSRHRRHALAAEIKNRTTYGKAAGFDVASNPEFLQEGRAIKDFFHPDRVVCGVETVRAQRLLADLYRPLNCPVLFTDLNTAELIKHTANAFLATKISFINMVSDICEAVGGDISQVAAGIGLDARIGRSFLNAGIGYGGYCLPKDMRAFINLGEENQVDVSLLREVEAVNNGRVRRFIGKVRQALWVMQGKTIAVLGLAFKAGTDDIRDAASLRVIRMLLEEGAAVQAYDPKAMENARRTMPEITGRLKYCASAPEAAQGAHALLVLTEWDEFKTLDLRQIRELMEVPVIVDGRNLCNPAEVRRAGFEYLCMGRTTPHIERRARRATLSHKQPARVLSMPRRDADKGTPLVLPLEA
jgi:UDPglucose 6-dehydrogenase